MYKKYYVFTSLLYRILVLVIYPLLAMSCVVYIQTGFFGKLPGIKMGMFVPATLLATAVSAVETVQDYFVFGGINGKNCGHFECLKGSEIGYKVYRGALIADAIRRNVLIAVLHGFNIFFGIVFMHEELEQDMIWSIAILIAWNFLCSNAGVLLERFAGTIWVSVAIAYLIGLVSMFMNFFFSIMDAESYAAAGIMTVIGIGLAAVEIKIALSKLERSYYDK